MDFLKSFSFSDEHKTQVHPNLSKSGLRAFSILLQGRNWKKLHFASQVVTPLDPPEIKIKGNICSVIVSDFCVSETCDGDYSKVKYDGCHFSVALLDDVLKRIYPGGKATVHGKATFQSILYEWGNDYEEFKRESDKEDAISLVLELSRNSRRVTLTVYRNNQYYEKIDREVSLFGTIK
jgi:hypothetical protein